MPVTESPFVHEALFYKSPEVLGAEVQAFVTAAQQAGEPVLVVAPSEHLELIRTALNGSEVDDARLRFEDVDVVAHNPCCLLAVYQDWIDRHDGPVRVVGETIWPGREYAASVECLRHEALVNHELAAAQASLLCPFDAERLDGSILAGAELTHPGIIDEAGRRRSREYGDPLELGSGARWPQPSPVEPVSEHTFAGDLSGLRAAVAADPIVGSLSSPQQADVVFAANEAASNALKHADGQCVVRLWRDGRCVVCEVVTESALPDAFAGRRRPAPEAPDGRGLWLVNHVCELVELRSDGEQTCLRMHVRDAV